MNHSQLPHGHQHGGAHRPRQQPPAYQQPIPPQYAPPAPPAPARNGLGIAALILGLVGTPFFLTGLTAPVAIVLGLIAVPLALVGLGRVRRREATNRGTSIAGLVLGTACVALGVLSIVVTVQAIDETLNGPTGAVVGVDGQVAAEQPSGPVPLGTTVDVDGLTVTVTDIEQKTAFGSRVTCAAVSYANGTGSEATRNPFDWAARNGDGASVNPTIYTGNDALDSGPLADGGTADGLVCFDVPRDDVVVVEYRASVFGDGPAAEWAAGRS